MKGVVVYDSISEAIEQSGIVLPDTFAMIENAFMYWWALDKTDRAQ